MPQQNIQGSGLGSLFAAALGSPAQDMRNQADAYRIRQQMDLAKQTADLKQREYEQSVLNDNRDYQLKQALNAATVSKTGVETTGLQQKNALLESQMSAANDLGPFVLGCPGPVRVPKQLVEMNDRQAELFAKLARKGRFPCPA